MKKFIIIHGYHGSQYSNWYPWFKNEIEMENLGEFIPVSLPNPSNPNVQEWMEIIKNLFSKYESSDLYVIGHSLGCIALIDALSEFKIKVKAIFLVSGFCQKIESLPELDSFSDIDLDWKFLQTIENKFCITAFDDTIIDYQESLYLARKLKGNCLILNQGGHFIVDVNVTSVEEFPELMEIIKSIN